VIWQANIVDAVGHITSDSMAGNAFTSTRVYDILDRLKSVQTGSGNAIQNDGYSYDAIGNLTERTWIDNSDVAHAEFFGYDALNRLTTGTGPADKSFSYDSAGNLTYKSDVGSYNYTPGTHQISSLVGTVNGVVNPSFSYDANGNIMSEAGLTATWTSFNMASTLTRGSSSSSFAYGPEHQRTEQIATSPSGIVTTYYAGSSFEQVVTSSSGVAENHYHISAYGRRIAMLVDASNGTASWRYFHQDHLSTVGVVTDQSGALVERLSYDAWGKRRNLDGTDSATPIVAIDKRGYTDQEELDNLGVVNMNARIYDPVIARFVSPDPIIQRPFGPQTHNRYSYVSNRPLRFVDPSGYDFYDDLTYALPSDGPDSPSSSPTGGSGNGSDGPSVWQNNQGTVYVCSADGGNCGEAPNLSGTVFPGGPYQGIGMAAGNASVNPVAPDVFNPAASNTATQQPASEWYGSIVLAQGPRFDELGNPIGTATDATDSWGDIPPPPTGPCGSSGCVTPDEAQTNTLNIIGKKPTDFIGNSVARLYDSVMAPLCDPCNTGVLDLAGKGAGSAANIANKIIHIFREGKNLEGLVQASGGSAESAYTAVQQAANQALRDQAIVPGANGVLPGDGAGAILNVNGVNVQLIGGRVINGEVSIGSFEGVP
jgi:RHS repeat-associated protein